MTEAHEEADLLVRVEDGISFITLNRPASGNALTPGQRERISVLLEEADGDQRIRVVVIGATGKHFCTGADLRMDRPDLEQGVDTPTGRVGGTIMKTIAYGVQPLIAGILDCQKPVIAAVQGTTAGIGVHLALACDLVVAAEEASFIEIFVRRGLVPDGGGAYLLPRLIGLQRAKELIFLGDRVPAALAREIGLVNRVVPAAALEGAVRDLALRLAEAPTVSVGLAKRLLNRSLDVDRTTAFFEEAIAQEVATSTADTAEGIAAFRERRPPVFRGY